MNLTLNGFKRSHKLTKALKRAQTPLQCHAVVSDHISYKMPHLLRLLQCRPLVSNNKSQTKNAQC